MDGRRLKYIKWVYEGACRWAYFRGWVKISPSCTQLLKKKALKVFNNPVHSHQQVCRWKDTYNELKQLTSFTFAQKNDSAL